MKNQIERISQQQFDQHMRVLIARHMAPSLSVIAVRECETVVAGGYGHPVLGEEVVVSAETVYLYGSMTSAITSMIVSTENGERSQQTATGIS
jgi:CubicO group peptidase (beta-lactamase class C family)